MNNTNHIVTVAKLQTVLEKFRDAFKAQLYDKIYPIGAIYMSINSTDPGTLFGGTWERIKDTFLLSAGDTYSAGATGGEATHTLTVDEMPSHTHSIKKYLSVGGNEGSTGLTESGFVNSSEDGWWRGYVKGLFDTLGDTGADCPKTRD